MKIGDIKIGKVDGKEEFFLEGLDNPDFNNFFMMPENVRMEDFRNRETYFISGFRGTGKTSLLRYALGQLQQNSKFRSISLFKSDIPEEKRILISKQNGANFLDHDSNKMGVAQDFKSAWTWFLLDCIAKIILNNPECCESESEDEKDIFLRILGLKTENPYKKVLGFLPKIKGASVTIGADIPFFSGKVDLNFDNENSTQATVSFFEIVDAALDALGNINFRERIAIGVDELEVFFINSEQYKRDLCMVRDLIFSIDRLNQKIRSKNQDIIILGAIRREVVDAIGPLGQEVTRIVHDRGINISWHHAQRSLHHPLINLIRKKISASMGPSYNGDPILDFFDANINGEPLDSFLLDRSFYRPRDIMWRLTFAQKAFSNRERFDTHVLKETEGEYSAQLWSEIEYELSASLSPDEISSITSIFSGISKNFFVRELEDLAIQKARFSKNVENFLGKHNIGDICRTLYTHGALGNDFRTGTTGSVSRNRWVFRGDSSLIIDQRMTLNPAIRKALSAIDARKRGSSGSGRGS